MDKVEKKKSKKKKRKENIRIEFFEIVNTSASVRPGLDPLESKSNPAPSDWLLPWLLLLLGC